SCPYTHSAPTELSTLSLHDALPIFTSCRWGELARCQEAQASTGNSTVTHVPWPTTELMAILPPNCLTISRQMARPSPFPSTLERDRKSTRLNSSHQIISYAVFCLKK